MSAREMRDAILRVLDGYTGLSDDRNERIAGLVFDAIEPHHAAAVQAERAAAGDDAVNAWPDPSRPGVPLNPERDGWHWLHHPEDLRPIPAMWNAELQGWTCGSLHSPGGIVDLGYRYLGPCLTPADHAAAVQAERAAAAEAMRKHAASRVWTTIGDRREIDLRQFLSDQIRALPLPDTSALAAAVEAARREGYKAGWNDREGDLLTGIDRVYGAAEEEAAIRARSGGDEISAARKAVPPAGAGRGPGINSPAPLPTDFARSGGKEGA